MDSTLLRPVVLSRGMIVMSYRTHNNSRTEPESQALLHASTGAMTKIRVKMHSPEGLYGSWLQVSGFVLTNALTSTNGYAPEIAVIRKQSMSWRKAGLAP